MNDTPGAHSARTALQTSMAMQRASGELPTTQEDDPMPASRPEVRLSEETIQYIAECTASAVAGAVAAAVGPAVTKGIDAALTDEKAAKVFEIGWRTVQQQAKLKAGTFVLGGLGKAARQVAWIGVFVLSMYMMFGWAGVKAAWHALSTGGA